MTPVLMGMSRTVSSSTLPQGKAHTILNEPKSSQTAHEDAGHESGALVIRGGVCQRGNMTQGNFVCTSTPEKDPDLAGQLEGGGDTPLSLGRALCLPPIPCHPHHPPSLSNACQLTPKRSQQTAPLVGKEGRGVTRGDEVQCRLHIAE